MNIKGTIKNISKNEKFSLITIQGKNGTYTIKTEKTKDYLKKKTPLIVTNVLKKREVFKTLFLTQDKSLVSIAPNIPLSDIEINSSINCKFFYHIMSFNGKEFKNQAKERSFYHAVKGMAKDSEVAKTALRFPLSIRRKFAYKPVILSTKFGLIIENALFFSKFPMVFKDGLTKGILLSIIYNQDKFVEIEEEKGTLQKKSVSTEEKQKILDVRNNLILAYLGEGIKQDTLKCDKKGCAAYKYCKKINESNKEFDLFNKYFSAFLEKSRKEKKILYKTLSKSRHPLRGALDVHPEETERKDDNFVYSLKIQNNEPRIKQGEEVLVSEKLPLNKKVKGEVVEKTFEYIKVKSKEELTNPGNVTPIDRRIPIESGLFDFIYGNSELKNIFLEGSKPTVQTPEEKIYIENDAEQNKAVNLIIGMNNLCIIKGENGTGKKFVARKAIENTAKPGIKTLVMTDSRREEFEQFFKEIPNVSNNKKDLSSVVVRETNERYPYTIEPQSFDYLYLFLSRDIDEKAALSLFSKAKKVAVFTNELNYPLIEKLREKFPENNTVELLTEHRFGEHILHFIQPIFTTKLKSIPDEEIKVTNKNLIDKAFLNIVNPEKYVEFVEIYGKSSGKKNRWNITEANFILETIKQFIKSGVRRNSIEVITAFERQKMLLQKMLADVKIPDIYVSTPAEAKEKHIVLISFVDKSIKNSQFRGRGDLKIALTRAKSKLILVGNKKVVKHSKTLSKIL